MQGGGRVGNLPGQLKSFSGPPVLKMICESSQREKSSGEICGHWLPLRTPGTLNFSSPEGPAQQVARCTSACLSAWLCREPAVGAESQQYPEAAVVRLGATSPCPGSLDALAEALSKNWNVAARSGAKSPSWPATFATACNKELFFFHSFIHSFTHVFIQQEFLESLSEHCSEGGAESKMQPSPLEFTFQSEGQAVNKHTHNIWSDGGEKVRGRCVMGVLSKLGN